MKHIYTDKRYSSGLYKILCTGDHKNFEELGGVKPTSGAQSATCPNCVKLALDKMKEQTKKLESHWYSLVQEANHNKGADL